MQQKRHLIQLDLKALSVGLNVRLTYTEKAVLLHLYGIAQVIME